MKTSALLSLVQFLETDVEGDSELPIDKEISAFLDGETDGSAVFAALYDDILDEPVPAHLLATVRDARPRPMFRVIEGGAQRDAA